MNLFNLPIVQKISSLCRAQVQADGTFSLAIYSHQAGNTPECTHTWKGSGRRSLFQWLALTALLTPFGVSLRCLCRLFTQHR